MKKLLIALFSAFCMVGVYAQETPSYRIDPIATANAPWKIGERMGSEKSCIAVGEYFCYYVFLGTLPDGRSLLQRFYIDGTKYSDPFLAVLHQTSKDSDIKFSIDGMYIIWHKNGQKLEQGNYIRGLKDGFWMSWHDNGQKWNEGNYLNGNAEGAWISWHANGVKMAEYYFQRGWNVGVWLTWNEKGNLISRMDFDNL